MMMMMMILRVFFFSSRPPWCFVIEKNVGGDESRPANPARKKGKQKGLSKGQACGWEPFIKLIHIWSRIYIYNYIYIARNQDFHLGIISNIFLTWKKTQSILGSIGVTSPVQNHPGNILESMNFMMVSVNNTSIFDLIGVRYPHIPYKIT